MDEISKLVRWSEPRAVATGCCIADEMHPVAIAPGSDPTKPFRFKTPEIFIRGFPALYNLPAKAENLKFRC